MNAQVVSKPWRFLSPGETISVDGDMKNAVFIDQRTGHGRYLTSVEAGITRIKKLPDDPERG